ncbi:MAG TPA: DUF4124 domain-containing protein [Rhodanobacteraceae bacterium]|nr:DUF4124 domain-containing protein [Rhodanobacteraceae bacterium]
MRIRFASKALWLCALLLACVPVLARAQVYRCTAANGSVAFQDHPCANGQRQTVVDVPSHAPPGYVPPPVATVLPPLADALPSPAYVPPPPPPLPVMYACVGAVNGKHYLAHRPPAPYLAPLGVMGYPPQSLSQTYGAPGGAGMSAPELSKPRIGRPSIAAGMTEVQDYCLPATHAEVCSYVQKQYDENEHALHLAMRSEQPPLEKREQTLQDQLRNCR